MLVNYFKTVHFAFIFAEKKLMSLFKGGSSYHGLVTWFLILFVLVFLFDFRNWIHVKTNGLMCGIYFGSGIYSQKYLVES